MNLLLSWAVLALGVWLATAIIPAVKVRGGIGSYFVVAALFGVLNFFLGWLVFVLVGVASLGILFFFRFLLRLIVDAIVLKMASGLSSRFSVGSFGDAFLTALIMSGVGTAAEWMLHHAAL